MVKIRVSYEKTEELEKVLSLLKSGRNEPKNVRISEKKGREVCQGIYGAEASGCGKC